jgi:4'-phosphopantetheinyl transferase EntD
MTDEQPTPWVHGSDEDIISTIAHALRYEGRKPTRQAEHLMARIAAERILEALKRPYIVTPKPPTPLATIAQHPKMGGKG